MSTPLYPLRVTPVFKERVWGGRRLSRWFPDLPPGRIGEAWVLSDHPQGRTPVASGPLAGRTLGELRAVFGADLLGTRGMAAGPDRFPLLFKLLDCEDDLSVQVHPPDDYPGLPPGELGKTEMWVVLEARPGARLIHGLRPGTTREAFAAAVREGRTLSVLREVPVQAGDVLYVPAGTVHALGAGLVVAEIQQSSDTTYRVYDYDRLGLDGKPRELHIEDALRVTDCGEPPAPGRVPALPPGTWGEICRSPYFVVEHGRCEGEWELETSPETFHALLVTAGRGAVAWAGGEEPLEPGAAVLIPAALGRYRLRGEFEALRVYLP
nr:MAG: mannose-6-phosphate isomerase [Bacillota bacterium]